MDFGAYFIISLIVMAALCIGAVFGYSLRKKTAENEIGSAEQEAVRIVSEAKKEAESKQREYLVEAREEILKDRTEAEQEIKESRLEIQKMEKRLQQREESLDKKNEIADEKEHLLAEKLKENDLLQEQIEGIKQEQIQVLERLSGLTSEQAKEFLVNTFEQEVHHDMAIRLKEIEYQTKEESEKKARDIISLAIQRYAAEHVCEATVSVVPLPNDEMKGRIIGREGRNIRTLETLTGVDLIIDDTPEAITLSSFDPVRREVARLSLEKLIVDGRIHPARIEEMVEKSKKEVEAIIKEEGESAILQVGIHNMHPELIKLLGRMKYRTSYGQNVLQHSIEVAHIAGMMACELGIDATLAKRAGLLHDIGKSVDHEVEGTHVAIGIELAKKYRENFDVIHAIEAHHGDVEAKTVIACLVQAADAVSAARPGARRENLESYIKRLKKLEELADSFNGVEKSFAIQAGREIRILVQPEVIKDEDMLLLARELSKKIESELEYPGQIKVHMIREMRVVEYAK